MFPEQNSGEGGKEGGREGGGQARKGKGMECWQGMPAGGRIRKEERKQEGDEKIETGREREIRKDRRGRDIENQERNKMRGTEVRKKHRDGNRNT